MHTFSCSRLDNERRHGCVVGSGIGLAYTLTACGVGTLWPDVAYLALSLRWLPQILTRRDPSVWSLSDPSRGLPPPVTQHGVMEHTATMDSC